MATPPPKAGPIDRQAKWPFPWSLFRQDSHFGSLCKSLVLWKQFATFGDPADPVASAASYNQPLHPARFRSLLKPVPKAQPGEVCTSRLTRCYDMLWPCPCYTTCNSPASTVKRTVVDTCVPCLNLWPSKQHNKVVACPFGINAASLCSGKTNTEERVSRDGVTGWCSRAFLELFHKQVYLLDAWLHPCGIGTPAFKLLHPLGFECLVFLLRAPLSSVVRETKRTTHAILWGEP